jgi:hypothetical protein
MKSIINIAIPEVDGVYCEYPWDINLKIGDMMQFKGLDSHYVIDYKVYDFDNDFVEYFLDEV